VDARPAPKGVPKMARIFPIPDLSLAHEARPTSNLEAGVRSHRSASGEPLFARWHNANSGSPTPILFGKGLRSLWFFCFAQPRHH
jgi:hypothetical protein